MYELNKYIEEKINLYSNVSVYNKEYKRSNILYIIWTILALFILSIIIIHSTIYNSLSVSMISIIILFIFIYYNYRNLKI